MTRLSFSVFRCVLTCYCLFNRLQLSVAISAFSRHIPPPPLTTYPPDIYSLFHDLAAPIHLPFPLLCLCHIARLVILFNSFQPFHLLVSDIPVIPPFFGSLFVQLFTRPYPITNPSILLLIDFFHLSVYQSTYSSIHPPTLHLPVNPFVHLIIKIFLSFNR